MKIIRKNQKKLPPSKRPAKEMPMRDTQLDKLTTKDLKELREQVDRAIAERQAGERSGLRETFRSMAEAAGYSLADVVGGGGARATKGRPVAAKFANPENRAETWSGRGRKPNWMSAKLKAGASMDDFRL